MPRAKRNSFEYSEYEVPPRDLDAALREAGVTIEVAPPLQAAA